MTFEATDPENKPPFACTECDWTGDHAPLSPLRDGRLVECPECSGDLDLRVTTD